MYEQGYPIKQHVLFHDNESAIKMENNGKDSCTGRSRHINIRRFFVNDRVDKGGLTVEYCSTKLMIADYTTEPLQGKQFEMFRHLIMGWKSIDNIINDIRTSVKERADDRNVMAEGPCDVSNVRTFKEALLGEKGNDSGK